MSSRWFTGPFIMQPELTQERTETPVHIGDLVLGDSNQVLSAILGSCVAVVLVDPKGAKFTMSHSLLPARAEPGQPLSARWVDEAVILGTRALGVPAARFRSLRASIAGGASMTKPAAEGTVTVGDLNVEAARTALHDRGIPIVMQDVGGFNGRRVVCSGDTFDCQVNLIPRSVWK